LEIHIFEGKLKESSWFIRGTSVMFLSEYKRKMFEGFCIKNINNDKLIRPAFSEKNISFDLSSWFLKKKLFVLNF